MKQPAFGARYWLRKDPGWYTHPMLGSIHREWGEWFWYPRGRGDLMKRGPFPTLKATVDLAEKEGKR